MPSRRVLSATAVALAAWAWFSGGGRWSLLLHPDEAKIAKWTRQSFESGFVTDRVYPGGWFQVARARAALARAVGRAGAKWDAWRSQDGAVVAVDENTFRPVGASAGTENSHFSVQPGRDFNAFLSALAAAFAFLCALELGAGTAGAAFGAAALCAQHVLVEHAHYCETDAALAAALAASCWLFSRFLRAPSARGAALALFVSGFAVSCKYTLAPLVAWIPVSAAVLVRARRSGGEPSAASAAVRAGAFRFAAVFVAAFAVFAAGFLLGTPALVRDPAWFRANAALVSARTYAETAGILGQFSRTWWGGPALRLGSFARQCAAMGWGFWFLAAAGAVAWAARVPRRQTWGIPLFAALFAVWTLFGLPWFRAQEFLPVGVVAAVAAAVPAGAAAELARSSLARRRRGM